MLAVCWRGQDGTGSVVLVLPNFKISARQIPVVVYTVLRLLMMDRRSSEICKVLYQNKLEKYCISLALIMSISIHIRHFVTA